MDVFARKAKASRCPVAAHAQASEAVIKAAKAGVTTIEHGFYPGDEALDAMQKHGTIFVPTLAVLDAERGSVLEGDFDQILGRTKKAWDMGLRMVCGGDTGAFTHGDNAREMELMVQAGMPIKDVLSCATIMSWEACGGDWCRRRFSCVEEGWAADLVALEGDVEVDFGSVRRIEFVKMERPASTTRSLLGFSSYELTYYIL